MSGNKWVNKKEIFADDEAFEIARGLYNSKVAVSRPPSLAQRGVYNVANTNPSSAKFKSMRSRPRSAKARINTEKRGNHTEEASTESKPPWRPFSGEASLSRLNKNNIAKDTSTVKFQIKGEVCKSTKEEEFICPQVYKNRKLPVGIAGLEGWLTADVPSDWCGIDPDSNFVFLPCLSSINVSDLPVVPDPQPANEQLVFTPDPEPWKYKPPPKSIFWKYLKTKSNSDSLVGNCELDRNSPDIGLNEQLAELGITKRTNFLVLQNGSEITGVPANKSHFQKYPQLRTIDIIRREIRDLENLLKGIGNPNASSIISQYQYEITLLRKAARETIKEYVLPSSLEETQQSLLQEEYSKFSDEHDEIIKAIRET